MLRLSPPAIYIYQVLLQLHIFVTTLDVGSVVNFGEMLFLFFWVVQCSKGCEEAGKFQKRKKKPRAKLCRTVRRFDSANIKCPEFSFVLVNEAVADHLQPATTVSFHPRAWENGAQGGMAVLFTSIPST